MGWRREEGRKGREKGVEVEDEVREGGGDEGEEKGVEDGG